MDKLKADETLDFHNKQIAEVALGERCKNSSKSTAYILTSPLGHIYTNACPDGLHCVKLYGDANYDAIKWDTKVDFIRASSFMPSNPHAKQLKKWLQIYFSNPLRCKEVEILFCGLEEYGDFNSNIWMTIYKTCPAGEMMSYSELAQRSGNSAGASKVVGYAINKNPYMLVVGDHRVIKASGEIWCENESQRNKLRRLLVKYEIGFTGESFEGALLKVKERNNASRGTRRRNTGGGAKSRIKKDVDIKPSTRGVNKLKRVGRSSGAKKAIGRKRKEELDEDSADDDEDFTDDED